MKIFCFRFAAAGSSTSVRCCKFIELARFFTESVAMVLETGLRIAVFISNLHFMVFVMWSLCMIMENITIFVACGIVDTYLDQFIRSMKVG